MNNVNFSIKKCLGAAWKLTKEHWLVLVGLYLGYFIVSQLISLFAGGNIYSVQYFLAIIIVLILSIIFNAGYTKMYLDAQEGKELEFSVFGRMLRKALSFFIINLFIGILVGIGICLFIYPGLWLASRIGLAPYILLDRENCSIGEAFRESTRITKGHSNKLVLLFLTFLLIALAGVICLFVGVFISVVVINFAMVCAYKYLEKINPDIKNNSESTDTTNDVE